MMKSALAQSKILAGNGGIFPALPQTGTER